MRQDTLRDKMRTEFANGKTLKELSEEYDVPYSSLRKISGKEQWNKLRNTVREQTEQMVREQTAAAVVESRRTVVSKLLEASELAVDRIYQKMQEEDLDSRDIRALTQSLIEMRNAYGIKSEKDREEQEARIAKLRHDVQSDSNDDKQIEIIWTGGEDFE